MHLILLNTQPFQCMYVTSKALYVFYFKGWLENRDINLFVPCTAQMLDVVHLLEVLNWNFRDSLTMPVKVSFLHIFACCPSSQLILSLELQSGKLSLKNCRFF